MRKIILFIVFISGLFFIAVPANAAIIPPAGKIAPSENAYKKIASLKIKDMEKMLGRKMKIKEKISFLILRHYAKHHTDTKRDQGKTSMTFGIFAVILFLAGLFFPPLLIGSLIASILALVLGSVARKDDPSDKKALAGILLGWITLGLIALLIILVAIIIASWSWI